MDFEWTFVGKWCHKTLGEAKIQKRQQSLPNEESFSLEMTGVYVEWLPPELTVGSVVDFGLLVRSQLIRLSRNLASKFLHTRNFSINSTIYVSHLTVANRFHFDDQMCQSKYLHASLKNKKIDLGKFHDNSDRKQDSVCIWSNINSIKCIKLWKFVINNQWPIERGPSFLRILDHRLGLIF